MNRLSSQITGQQCPGSKDQSDHSLSGIGTSGGVTVGMPLHKWLVTWYCIAGDKWVPLGPAFSPSFYFSHIGTFWIKKKDVENRAQPKPPKPGTYREPGSVKFSKNRNRNLPGSPKTWQTSNRNLTRNRTENLRPYFLVWTNNFQVIPGTLYKLRTYTWISVFFIPYSYRVYKKLKKFLCGVIMWVISPPRRKNSSILWYWKVV